MKQIKQIRRWYFLPAILLISFSLQAQDIRPVSKTYAIEGVRIVQAPGKVIESGTIVIDRGVIRSVGSDVSVPPGAIRISADSLTVYAGFIAGFSHAGVPEPKEDQSRPPKEKDPGNPSYERAGITPWVSLRETIKTSDNSIAEHRKAGFTLAMSAPYGRMLPGETGLVLLSGNDNMLIKDGTSMYAQLEGARGVYPNTVIGVMAKFRELYRQAQLSSNDSRRFGESPANMERPVSDQAIEALYPVISGAEPVVFSAPDIKSIQRVMALRQELGFNYMLTDVKQGWDMTDRIKSAGIPVFISLDLPEWKEELKDSANTIDDEKEALVKRQVEFIAKQYSLPASWSAAGINFGFSTNGAKPADIHKHMLKMKEAGVSEDVLLAGLTTQPAQLLGVSGFAGTVEEGKMANLVITDKSYFEEEAAIRYVFVEGQLFEMEAPKKKSDSKDDEISAIGKWTYSASTPDGNGIGTIEIKGSPASLSGTLTDKQSGTTFALEDVKLDKDVLSFGFTFSDGTNQLPLKVSVVVDGASFEGSVDAGPVGSFPITGNRIP